MEHRGAKGLFLLSLAVVGGVLAYLLSQVPQPWRGILVAWLLLVLTIGALVLRLVRHHYEYLALRLTLGSQPRRARHVTRAQKRRRTQDLRVVSGAPRHDARSIV